MQELVSCACFYLYFRMVIAIIIVMEVIMKKRIFGLLLMVFLISACGQVPKLENGQEAIVSFNNGQMISVDDFYNQIKEQYGLSTLVKMIDTQVLNIKFPDYEKTAKEKAEAYLSSLMSGYSSEAEFLTDLQQYLGFTSVEDYKEYLTLSYYEQYATEEYIKENLSDKDIEDYYKKEIKEDIEISHILIVPDVTDNMTDAEKTSAESKALSTANTVIQELKNTKSTELVNKFSELAKKYSEDDTTKNKGGSLGRINTDTLGSSYQELVDAAYSIKDGAYYTKVVKSAFGYHIILRTKSYEKASLDSVKDKIVEALVNKEMNENASVGINAMQHYRQELGMSINDSKLNTEFNNYVTNALSTALNS